MDETRTESHIWKMKELGVHIIASIYDFAATPVPEEMMRCLKYMEEMGAAVGDVSASGQILVGKRTNFCIFCHNWSPGFPAAFLCHFLAAILPKS